jgi:hypothetical protein
MAYEVNWHTDDQTVIRIAYYDEMEWETLYASLDEAYEMIRSVDHMVDMIIHDQIGLPRGNPMVHFQNAVKNQPPNAGDLYVIPGGSRAMLPFIKQIANIVVKGMPGKVAPIFVSSLEEAESRIAERV